MQYDYVQRRYGNSYHETLILPRKSNAWLIEIWSMDLKTFKPLNTTTVHTYGYGNRQFLEWNIILNECDETFSIRQNVSVYAL